ncbi:MAG: 6-carboxytetrahydropterin synthase QueD [Fimbriimonadaceae bacterium]
MLRTRSTRPFRELALHEIFKCFNIDSAHWLPNVPTGHKCGRMHGHTFQIEIHVAGPINHVGWVMDFGDIKDAFERIRERIDHRVLNEVPGLENPTSEVLAEWIWNELQPSLPMLSKVVVRETCTSGCTYSAVTVQ